MIGNQDTQSSWWLHDMVVPEDFIGMLQQQSTESPTVFMSPVLPGVVFDYYFEELSEQCGWIPVS